MPGVDEGRCPDHLLRGRTETRLRILTAAFRLFAENGFDNTSMRAIARRCGMTDAGVYYYYPTKRALMDALWSLPPPRPRVAPSSVVTAERLKDLVDVLLDAAMEHETFARLLLRGALDGEPGAVTLRNRTMAIWRDFVTANFTEFLPEEQAALQADALLMLTFGVMVQVQTEHREAFAAIFRGQQFRERVNQMAQLALRLNQSNVAS